MRVLVTGAGGFIGGHLVGRLLDEGADVRAVDWKPKEDWYQFHYDADNWQGDLSRREVAVACCSDVGAVYNLAANMGGMGFIANNKADCMLSVLTSTHMLLAAQTEGVERFFYSSSACIYPDYLQDESDVLPLSEQDAYPAMPEDGYGWEKLFSERMARHFYEDYGLVTRQARYHNVYGPYGTYDGGREKAPAALCRKIIEAAASGEHAIDIWGDGEQTRSFMYVDDCIEGTLRIMDSECPLALNLGSERLVTINELVDIIEGIAGVTLKRNYDLSKPQGVRGRNSDNTLLRANVGWEPQVTLEDGLEKTYAWIKDQMGV